MDGNYLSAMPMPTKLAFIDLIILCMMDIETELDPANTC